MKKTYICGILMMSFNVLAATENAQVTTPVYKTAAEIETSCRIKAKEVAAETYRGCVTEQKSTQIEQIKKEYAERLNALKAHYEQELKKLAGQAKGKAEAIAPTEPGKKNSKSVAVKAKPGLKKNGDSAKTIVPDEKSSSEMTIQLKAAPGEPSGDESSLDLPEPIPVEEPAYN